MNLSQQMAWLLQHIATSEKFISEKGKTYTALEGRGLIELVDRRKTILRCINWRIPHQDGNDECYSYYAVKPVWVLTQAGVDYMAEHMQWCFD